MTTPSDASSWQANEGQPADTSLPVHGEGAECIDNAVPAELGAPGGHAEAAELGDPAVHGDGETPPEKPARRAPRVKFQTEEELQHSITQAAELRAELVAISRRIARAEADRARVLAKLQQLAMDESQSLREADVRARSLAAECAVAMNMSDRTVLTQMNDSHRLVTEYPAILEALDASQVTLQHARAVLSEGINVASELLPDYEKRCLAAAKGASPGRLQRKAREIADRLSPRSIDERHRIAAEERRVWYRELPDGMAEAGVILPAVLMVGIKDRVDRIAKAIKNEVLAAGNGQRVPDEAPQQGSVHASQRAAREVPGDVPGGVSGEAPSDAQSDAQGDAGSGWSLNVYRADVFAELLLTGIPSTFPEAAAETLEPRPTAVQRHAAGIQGRVSITVPVGGTAQLDGYGPIDAATARHLTAVAPGWDQIHVNAGGEVLATSRRQPTEAMRRILRARDQHCRYPGCFVPVDACEIDHTLDWAKGGPTEITNLGHLCPKHHLLKHPDLPRNVRWDAYQDSRGVFTWVSPTGERYFTTPEGSIVFAPDQGPPGRQTSSGSAAKLPWGKGFEAKTGEGSGASSTAGVGSMTSTEDSSSGEMPPGDSDSAIPF